MFSKKVGVLVLVLVLFSLNTFAANLTPAYEWLNSQKPTDIYSSAWAALALSEVNGGNSLIQYLENQKDPADCWPKGSCKPKETALVALALSKSGKNIDKSLDWLKSHQDITLTGEWLLQIKTDSEGQCDVTYTTTQAATKKINVDKGFITSDKCTTPSTFFNLGSCLEQNLLLTKAALEFDLKCTFSGEISSVYRDAGIYFLNDDVVTGNQAKIKINNGNFGSYEDTLITNWILEELNPDVNSLIYLRKNFRENDVKSNAFLYIITQKQNYINELSNLQKTDKSFGNVFEINSGEDYLSCPLDCFCGDSVCDSSESPSSCPSDCESISTEEETKEELEEEPEEETKEERSFGFLWFLLIAIILGVIGFLAYKKLP